MKRQTLAAAVLATMAPAVLSLTAARANTVDLMPNAYAAGGTAAFSIAGCDMAPVGAGAYLLLNTTASTRIESTRPNTPIPGFCAERQQTASKSTFITHEGTAPGSPALALLTRKNEPSLDFESSLQGGSGPGCLTFTQTLNKGHSIGGSFSGAMPVPEPTTIALLAFDGLALSGKCPIP